MIVYLKHNEIDKDLWDACVSASGTCKPYAYSWYLDIMSPGWEALIDDDYDSVFPVPVRKKYGIKYIATPIFLQQLGACSPDKSEESAIVEFLDYMPEFYWLIDLCVAQKVTNRKYKITTKENYTLNLNHPYDKIRNGFENSCRKDIDRSYESGISLTWDFSPNDLIDLFIKTKADVAAGIKDRDFARLKELMEFTLENGTGRISGVRNETGKMIYGQFIIMTPGHINMLFRVNAPESRELRVNYYAVNELIREFSGTKNILDFAGSSIPSIATFIRSFGAECRPYYRLYRNRLPVPFRWLK